VLFSERKKEKLLKCCKCRCRAKKYYLNIIYFKVLLDLADNPLYIYRKQSSSVKVQKFC
jgi:hypothetical protein